jgi:hypothetical protein
MFGLSLFLQHVGLAWRLMSTHPQLEADEALAHARAAQIAKTPELSAELLLAMAYVESRFNVFALSHVEGQKRKISRHRSDEAPRRWRKGTSLFCGPLQTYAATWSDCMKQRELGLAYVTGAKEMSAWLRDRRVRGDITRALAGYGCGNRGVKTGKCNRYQGRVLYQARRLEVKKPIAVAARS